MRIVGGELSGRRFASPQSKSTRATSERVREGIASALQSRRAFKGAKCLDLYAGTGAYAFEAISRGAATAVSIDQQSACVAAIAKSAAELSIADRVTTVKLSLNPHNIEQLARRIPTPPGGFDLVFADPPYDAIADAVSLLDRLLELGVISRRAWVVLEHGKATPPAACKGLETCDDYLYGDSAIRLMRSEQV